MSIGNILATAAPIAAGYYTGGMSGGFMGLSEGVASGIAAGALTGAGIAALSGGNILTSAAMGGLGGYGGAEMFTAFNPATANNLALQTGTTTAVQNQAAMSGLTGGNALGQGGAQAFGAGAGAGAGAFTNGYSPYATPDVLGESVTQVSGFAPSNIGTVGANTPVGLTQTPAINSANLSPFQRGATTNIGMGNAGSGFASRTPGVPDQFSGGYDPTTEGYVSYAAPDTSFSAGVERLGGGSTGKGAMKLGLAGLAVLGSGVEPETFTYDQMKEAEAYDPDETLNLLDPELDSGIEDVINEDSGLRLYANQGGMVPTYAEGGTVETRANQGMTDALARNQGTAYAQPTTNASSNVNAQPALNINRGMGSLNVNSGSIGQSANAVAETARLKAIEDAKPKTTTMQGMYGTQMTVPIDYDPGGYTRKPSHYQLQDGTYVKGTPPSGSPYIGGTSDRTNAYGYINRFAEGGTIESRANQGMTDALARNQGTAYTQPTTAYTPTTAPSNNIKIAGADNSTSNIRGGVGSLNIGSGTIGQSANAIAAGAEAARLKAIEDAKPKGHPMEFVMGQGMRPVGAIEAGPLANYSSNLSGTGYTFNGKQYGMPGYAEGGTIESRADQGMRDALARNKGTAYSRPTTAYTPTTAPSNNIKIAGADNSTSNIGRGVGALNVGSGSIGQSPNAIKAAQVAAAAAADRKANFKIMPNGQEVPIDFNPGGFQGVMGGMQNAPQSHYRDSSGNWHKGQRPGTFQIGGNNGSSIGAFLTPISYYAQGGMLEGPGDGMSDSLAAQIDGSQPAALSQGEFVLPADIVSHLGNGSSDAGSKRLYAMMDEVRLAKTGRKKQSPEIDPERYMPA